MIFLYTDGSAQPTNPGYGGWSWVAVDPLRPPGAEVLQAGHGGVYTGLTTNNRMELAAAVDGLMRLYEIARYLESKVTVVSDSKYVVNGAEAWLAKWKTNGWRKADKSRVLNRDLWEALDWTMELHRDAVGRVAFVWTKGHSGTEWNDHADTGAEVCALAAERIMGGERAPYRVFSWPPAQEMDHADGATLLESASVDDEEGRRRWGLE